MGPPLRYVSTLMGTLYSARPAVADLFYSFKGGEIVAATTFFRLQGDYLRSFVLRGIMKLMKRFLYENPGLNCETTFYAFYMIGGLQGGNAQAATGITAT